MAHSEHPLTAVDGDFYALPDTPGILCATVWDPVTVVAEGTWHGLRVTYEESFSNACFAAVGTDNVYRF